MRRKPALWCVSADEAIEHFKGENYSYSTEMLPDFASFDSGSFATDKLQELKKSYDELLTKNIVAPVQFYSIGRLDQRYQLHNLSRGLFTGWLTEWWYDDDLVLMDKCGSVSVFHHSGYIFRFEPKTGR